MSRRWPVMVVLGLCVVLAGCGGDDAPTDQVSPLLRSARASVLHSNEPAIEARTLGEVRAAGRRADEGQVEVRVAMKQLADLGASTDQRVAETILAAESSYLRSLSRLARLSGPRLSIWGPVRAQMQRSAATIEGAAAGLSAGADGTLVPPKADMAATVRRISRVVASAAKAQAPVATGGSRVPVAGNCGSYLVQEPSGARFTVSEVTATNVGCGEARAMIASGPSGRRSAGWNCPLTGDKTYTSCTRGSQSVSWNIPGGGSASPAPAKGGDCGAFATSGPDGSFTATNLQIGGISCADARAMIASGPSGRASSGWSCPLTGDKAHTACTRDGESVSWDIVPG